MKYFACLLDPTGQGIPDAMRRPYEVLPSVLRLECKWRSFAGAAVLSASDERHADPLIAEEGDEVAAGTVRLDNREDIERWTDSVGLELTDLQLVLRLVAQSGTGRIRDILGDFAFVVLNQARRTAVAATDAFSVRRLFYARHGQLVAFASRAEALSLEDRYEEQYLAERVAVIDSTPGLTPYAGVRALPPGTLATVRHNGPALQQYWSADEFEPAFGDRKAERDAPDILQGLLAESVRARLSDGHTWAHLSGGLDSSSIVCVAQWLKERGNVPHGLAGTITYVDWEDTDADEREYADSVVRRWGVRNETIVDPPTWLDEDGIPPRLDEPVSFMAFHPRNRRQGQIVRGAGGRVLLAGVGSDELFTGSTLFFADRLVRGHLWGSARDLAHWAVTGRMSFWSFAYRSAVLPLVPLRLRRPGSVQQGRLLPWVSDAAARQYGLRRRTNVLAISGGRLGRKYHDAMAARVKAFAAEVDASAVDDTVEMRFPFLSRPLVEFALRLPPEACARPYERKWVLREALRGILPELVRTRIGKGASTDALVHSLSTQRSLLEPLVREPMLADLGIVDATQLRTAFERAPIEGNGENNLGVDVQLTLTVEAWLQIRSGTWPQEPS